MQEVFDKKHIPYGECSIRPCGDGTYEAKYIAGIDPVTGKVIHETVCGETTDTVHEKLAAAIAAKKPCKLTIAEWRKIWSADIWNTYTYNRKQLFAVRFASSKLQVMQDICESSKSRVSPYSLLIFEVAPEILADPEGFTLEDIKDLIKPLMKEHLQQMKKVERIFAKRHVELAKYMAILDMLLAAPVPEADYAKACKPYPMSMSEYREAERLAGILLFLEDEPQVIRIHSSDSHCIIGFIPNFLAFQWLDEIRHEEERAKDASRHEDLASMEGYGAYANSNNSMPLTDPRNEQVWMRAVKEWLDKTQLVRNSGQRVCDFCAGPCGDCPHRWSDDPHSCDFCAHEYEELTECTNCPFDSYRFISHKAASSSRNPYYPEIVPAPAPDPSLL